MTRKLTKKQLEKINAISWRNITKAFDYLKAARVFANDEYKVRRLKDRRCVWCYYCEKPRYASAAGATDAKVKCQICGVEHLVSMHLVKKPKVCQTCSDTFGLCVECSGSLDMYVSKDR